MAPRIWLTIWVGVACVVIFFAVRGLEMSSRVESVPKPTVAAWRTEEDRVGQIISADGVRCYVYYGHQAQSISCVKVRP